MAVLKDLLTKIEYECVCGTLDKEVTDIVYDSRNVSVGSMFVCIPGLWWTGMFAALAVSAGAGALLVEKEMELPENTGVTVIRVEDTHYAMAFVSMTFYGYPAEEMKIIGITGTKGKTTTTYLVKSILEQAGRKVGLIGTIEIIIGDTHIHADHTTPESVLIQKYFRQMADAGCDTVVMEVSSQGLMPTGRRDLSSTSAYLPTWNRIISVRGSIRILKIICTVRDCFFNSAGWGSLTGMMSIGKPLPPGIHVRWRLTGLIRKRTFVRGILPF